MIWSRATHGYCAMLLITLTLQCEPAAAQKDPCEGLLDRDFSQVPDAPTHLTGAMMVAESGWPRYCKVEGYVTPQVVFELRVPLDSWNQRLLFIGCGGFCGILAQINRCQAPMQRGYACVTTNLGHRSTPIDGKWAYNNRALEIDFYYRATHVTAQAAKAIVAALAGEQPRYSYLNGCSTGGRQGLISAQRFPADFNGVIVGAPAGVSPGGGLHLIWSALANRDADGNGILSQADVSFLAAAVMAQCDELDGVQDSIIDYPPGCQVDTAALACPQPGGACLTPAQIEVVRKIYTGPQSKAGEPLYSARPMPGSEPQWVPAYVNDNGPAGYYLFGGDFFRYLAFAEDPGPLWRPEDFDWQRDPPRLGFMRFLNYAANPDLNDFVKRGGKLILYQGWGDESVAPQGTIDYFELAARTMGGRDAADQFMRLYMMPGMAHCAGGAGADQVDWLTHLERWVERDQAPGQVVARKLSNDGSVAFARPLAPYPARARYTGAGDWRSPDNFLIEAGDAAR